MKPVIYISMQKSRLEATEVLSRLDVLMPRICLNVVASALSLSHIFCLASTRHGQVTLRYHHLFIYVFNTFKTKLHLCIKQRF